MKTKSSRQPDGNGLPALRDGLLLKLQLQSDPKLLSVVRGALERLTEVLGFSASALRRDPRSALIARAYVGPAPVGLIPVADGRLIVVADSRSICFHSPLMMPARI